jgi:hypothetical protein
MSATDPHTVFRKRLMLHDAGLLTEEEEAGLEAHAEACLSCREIRDAHVAEKAGREGDHIPSAMLARWDRVAASARGLERELLGRHLASCENCRRDLEVIGHEPVLLGETEAAPPEAPSGEAGTTRILPIEPRQPRRAWFQGAAVGAVLAAAAVIIVARPSPRPIDSESLPWVVPGTPRGSAPGVEVSPGTRRLVLALPTPSTTPEQRARLTVTDPSGVVLMDMEIAPERLRSPTLMIVLSTPDPLPEGLYTVDLFPEGAVKPQVTSFRVTVAAS